MSINPAITSINIKCHERSEIKSMSAFNCINEDESLIVSEQSRPIPFLSVSLPGESCSHNQSLSSAFSTAWQTFAVLGLLAWDWQRLLLLLVCSDHNQKHKGWTEQKCRVDVLPPDAFKNFKENYQVVFIVYISSQVNIIAFDFIPCSRTFHCSVCYSYCKNKLEQLIG